MAEYLIPYLILFCIITVIAVISVIAQKVPFVGAFFSLLKRLFILFFMVIWGSVIIFAYSFLAAIAIWLATFFVEDNHFMYTGERINPLFYEHAAAMIKLSATYGLLYFFTYIACTLLFAKVRIYPWIHTALIALTTAFIVTVSYPILIHSLYPDLTVTQKGASFLVLTIFLTAFKPSRMEADTYDSNPLHNILIGLTPFLSKVEGKSLNNNEPTNF